MNTSALEMNDQSNELQLGLQRAVEAARDLAGAETQTINTVLEQLASRALECQEEVLRANALDLARMPQSDPKYDRLLLNPERLEAIAGDLRAVAALSSPVGEVLEQRARVPLPRSARKLASSPISTD